MKTNLEPDNSNKINLDIKVITIIKIVGVILLMLAAAKILGKIAPVLMLILISIILAIALNPIVVKINLVLKKLKIKNRTLATSLAFFFVIACLLGMLVLAIFPLIDQVGQFARDLPAAIKGFLAEENFVTNLVNQYNLNDGITEFTEKITGYFTEDFTKVTNLVGQFFSLIANVVIVLFLTFMFLIHSSKFANMFKKFLQPNSFKRCSRLFKEMSNVIVSYVDGQIMIAVIGGLLSFVFMSFIGVPNALPLAAISAFFTLIPLIGTTIGAIVVIALTMLNNFNLAIALAIWFVAYQLIENVTIQPFIQGKHTNLSVLQVFVVSLIGAYMAGMIGVLLAIPVAACIKIVAADYFNLHKEKIVEMILNFHKGKSS